MPRLTHIAAAMKRRTRRAVKCQIIGGADPVQMRSFTRENAGRVIKRPGSEVVTAALAGPPGTRPPGRAGPGAGRAVARGVVTLR